MADDLVEIKTNFFIGNYSGAIHQAESLNDLPPQLAAEKKIFLYRSHLAQGNFAFVLDEIEPTAEDELKILRLLALYMSDEDIEGAKSGLQEELKKVITSEVTAEFLVIAAALVFMGEGDLEEALRCAMKSSWLEGKAIATQIYLQMNRPDIAEKEIRQMQQVDDDSVITQLAQAWTYAALGGEKANQASYIYEELIEKYGSTNYLLNGQAVCKMACGQFFEAESLLMQIKDNKDKNTLICQAVCAGQTGKPTESVNRKVKQVKSLGGRHGWVSDLEHHEQLFDTAAARYNF